MSITSLPVELLTHICQFIEPQDWGALRLTCRKTYDNTLEAYKTHFFKTISLLLTREGLQCLEGIAASETFRASVQEICVSPDLFDGWLQIDMESFTHEELINMPMPLRESSETKAGIEALFAVYEAAIEEHRAILDSSVVFDTLEKCLPRLGNVVDVRLRSHLIPPRLHTTETSIRCLGLRELRGRLSPALKYNHWRMVRFRLERLSIPHSLVFAQLLNSIIGSNRKLQSLYTCSGVCCGIKLESFHLPESDYQLLLPLLDDLTTLHMCICIRDQKTDQFDEGTFKRLLGILITVSPQLKILTFAQWSSMQELPPIYFEDLSHRVRFSQLEELHLHSIEVTVNTLEDFLRTAAPTLKRLSMRLVSLVDAMSAMSSWGPMNDDGSILSPLISTEVRPEIRSLWKRVFEFLADNLELQFVQLSTLGYRRREVTLQDDLYKERGQPDAETSTSLSLEDLSFDAERASVSFRQWASQLRVKTQHPPALGVLRITGTTTRIRFRYPIQMMLPMTIAHHSRIRRPYM